MLYLYRVRIDKYRSKDFYCKTTAYAFAEYWGGTVTEIAVQRDYDVRLLGIGA